ncbi:DUF2142 domain-containing protein [Paenibacillus sp. Dod16]|uniref:DUF2142 domain-containing protein n=1 Tax=Paenibacillus sp. Dod16 TaxID=3416392 RepID=UPI003CE9992D
MKKNFALWIILTIMLIKGLVWTFIIPPLQNPDEPVHFAYVQFMGEENRMPIQTSEQSFSHELNLFTMAVKLNEVAFKPESKYSTNQPIYDMLSKPENNNPLQRVSDGSNLAAGYPPGYYFFASLFYKLGYETTIIFRFYAVRIFSVLLSLVAVTLAYFAGKKMEPNSNFLASVLAITTGMHPMFSMIGSAVNNDIMMDVVSIALLLWLFTISTGSISKKTLIIGGLLCGFGLIIKAHMVYVCGFILFSALLIFIKKYGIKFTLRSAVIVSVPMLILYLPWAFFSLRHYGSFTGGVSMQPQGDVSLGLKWYFQNAFLNEAGRNRFFDLWIRTYWAKFGWLDTRFNSILIYKLVALIVITGLTGAVYGIIRRRENYKIVLFCLLFSIGNVLFLYLVEIIYFSEYHNFMLQGRYLFTSLVPINLVLIYGFKYIFQKHTNYVYYSAAFLMILFNLMSISLIYSRYY